VITRIAVALTVAGLSAAALLAQAPQGAASPGSLRPRPGADRTPEFPEPTITQYKPRTTLKVAEHPVPRAKYPVIDIHSHQPTPISQEQLARVVEGMDRNNLRVLVNLSGSWGTRLREGIDAIARSPHKDRMVVFANVDFTGVGTPGWAARAAATLAGDIEAGARGLKIFKDLGLRIRKADGSRLRVDDPELDPIWATCGRLGVPVLIHTAEPQEFFEPIDVRNERWLELALFKDRRYPAGEFPRFEELLAERDRMFRRHPATTFIAAHFGYRANDLARAAEMVETMPNVYPEVAAILAELGRQPRAARDFFVRYQDRVLFGKDAFQPDEYPYYWRVFETNDEYFDYYRDYHAFWKLYGMGLPDDVLKKLYYKNALKIVPGLPTDGWPQ
jgi:predicted TIM-barrel fold metal-dependent hydrolase